MRRKDGAHTVTVAGQEVVPVDAVARRVIGGGFRYVPEKRITQDHWDAPPHTFPVPDDCPDLTGGVRGRMTIVGYLGSSRHGGSRWLARCACGRYEARLGHTWRKGVAAGKSDCCQRCAHLEYLRRHDEFVRLGRNTE